MCKIQERAFDLTVTSFSPSKRSKADNNNCGSIFTSSVSMILAVLCVEPRQLPERHTFSPCHLRPFILNFRISCAHSAALANIRQTRCQALYVRGSRRDTDVRYHP